MGDILRQAAELQRRQAEGAAAQQELVELSRKRAGEFITMMHQHGVRPTGCYAMEMPISRGQLAAYHRIGAGWVVEKADVPRERYGIVLLESGHSYPFEGREDQLALQSITERPFIVVDPKLPELENPVPTARFADESGLNTLVWAAQRLGALPSTHPRP